jgi:phosphate transport system substrate-binding protein
MNHEDVAARRLFVAAAALGLAGLGRRARAQAVDAFSSAALKGAGSTFAHPLMAAWATEYRRHRKGPGALPAAGGGLDSDVGGVALDYEAVGSQAGIQRLRAAAVDFAASEMPLPVPDLQRGALVQVPLVAGAVALAVNLPARSAPLRLTPEVVADIFLGRIRRWSEPAIAALNDGAALPDAPIAVQHRSDGSGTTFTFTTFLLRTSAAWQGQLGADLLVNWPVGDGHRGNDGVARAIARTPHAIGYVSDVAAAQARLQVAQVRNAAGRFVAPTADGVRAALAAAPWDAAAQFGGSLVSLPGDASYPIVAAVYGLYSRELSARRVERVRDFFEWALTLGQPTALRLGYVSLPATAQSAVLAAMR